MIAPWKRKNRRSLSTNYLFFRIQDIEAFIGGGGKHAHKIDVLKKISDIVTDFKDELTGGSNLLVSDTKLNYKNAQKSCEAIGMFLGT